MKRILALLLTAISIFGIIETEVPANANEIACAEMDAYIEAAHLPTGRISSTIPNGFRTIGRRETGGTCDVKAHNQNRGTADHSVCWFQINFLSGAVAREYVSQGFGFWNVFEPYGCTNLAVYLWNKCGRGPWNPIRVNGKKIYPCDPPPQDQRATPVPAPWETPLALAA